MQFWPEGHPLLQENPRRTNTTELLDVNFFSIRNSAFGSGAKVKAKAALAFRIGCELLRVWAAGPGWAGG